MNLFLPLIIRYYILISHQRFGPEDIIRFEAFSFLLTKMNKLALAVFGIFILPQDCFPNKSTDKCKDVRPKGFPLNSNHKFDCMVKPGI